MCFHDANRSPQEIQKAGSSRKGEQGAAEKPSSESNNSSVPLFLQYPVPYTQDAPTPLLVSQSPSKLQFGNPYSMSDSKGRFPPQKVTPTFCSLFSGSHCRIQMMVWILSVQTMAMRSSQMISCSSYPLWARPLGTVMLCVSNPPATTVGQKATRSQRRSKTTTTM